MRTILGALILQFGFSLCAVASDLKAHKPGELIRHEISQKEVPQVLVEYFSPQISS
jgi:hypothetical protein